jgi:predicted transcriptional regulator
MADLINARAVTEQDRSEAIVVSFNKSWQNEILGGQISTIIRKRIPTTFKPTLLYFHLNSPISSIVGRARIVGMKFISSKEAISLQNDLHMPAPEITDYINGAATIGMYKIEQFETAKPFATCEAITKKLNYTPPQSFFILSKAALNAIDQLCGFAK